MKDGKLPDLWTQLLSYMAGKPVRLVLNTEELLDGVIIEQHSDYILFLSKTVNGEMMSCIPLVTLNRVISSVMKDGE